MATSKKNTEAKVDSVPWVVRTPGGEEIGKGFSSFHDANSAAESYRNSTGQHAAAVRM